MAIRKASSVDDTVTVETEDGTVFTYSPILPKRERLVLVGVQLADRDKEPEAHAAAIAEAKRSGLLG